MYLLGTETSYIILPPRKYQLVAALSAAAEKQESFSLEIFPKVSPHDATINNKFDFGSS